ncbi:MAG: hypothetical protein IBJ09_12075 [Bacteroidia bacterium]|nr:hypothetical protein [Bacteroidia bacterium]
MKSKILLFFVTCTLITSNLFSQEKKFDIAYFSYAGKYLNKDDIRVYFVDSNRVVPQDKKYSEVFIVPETLSSDGIIMICAKKYVLFYSVSKMYKLGEADTVHLQISIDPKGYIPKMLKEQIKAGADKERYTYEKTHISFSQAGSSTSSTYTVENERKHFKENRQKKKLLLKQDK